MKRSRIEKESDELIENDAAILDEPSGFVPNVTYVKCKVCKRVWLPIDQMGDHKGWCGCPKPGRNA